MAEIEARSRAPPADEIESHQDAGGALAEEVLRAAQSDLEDADDTARVIDERGPTGALRTQHPDREQRSRVLPASPNDLALVEAQSVTQRVADHAQVRSGRR